MEDLQLLKIVQNESNSDASRDEDGEHESDSETTTRPLYSYALKFLDQIADFLVLFQLPLSGSDSRLPQRDECPEHPEQCEY